MTDLTFISLQLQFLLQRYNLSYLKRKSNLFSWAKLYIGNSFGQAGILQSRTLDCSFRACFLCAFHWVPLCHTHVFVHAHMVTCICWYRIPRGVLCLVIYGSANAPAPTPARRTNCGQLVRIVALSLTELTMLNVNVVHTYGQCLPQCSVCVYQLQLR